MNEALRKLIDETKRLDRGATPGSYAASPGSLSNWSVPGPQPDVLVEWVVNGFDDWTRARQEIDTQAMAHCRNAAPVLAAEVERLDARLAEVERERDVALADVARLTPPKLAYALSVAAPTRPPSNTCNKHDDCEAADREAETAGKWRATHCYDETCDDCFGS